ncbi:MAG: PD-(D/E)XK nuclease family transposase [Lachnospiraceae bacterium]|nr:PD-(D/E)XK nuclease family transposase [Lachnospiraceae bacterium]
MAKEKERREELIGKLTLFDDELMSKVFDENIEATEYLIKTILGKKKLEVKQVKGEYRINSPRVGGRSITLDILAVGTGGREFDVEVQNDAPGAHVRRARFHSSMMDSRMLRENQELREIKDSYVIFIYRHDKFRLGLPVYHIERFVKEAGKEFGDGSHIIYVNGKYKGSGAIGRLIHDFHCQRSEEMYSSQLAKGVKHFKETEEGREEMSDIVERYAEEREKRGEKRGEKKGEKRAVVKNVRSLMETMKWNVEQALDALKINEKKEREAIIKAVQG